MGTSTSPAQFSQKITKLATVTQASQKATVEQGALTTKEIIFASAAAKGVKRESRIAGAKWGIRYDIKGFNNPTALLKMLGPFHLVENDTKPHTIYRKGRRAKGRGSSKINKAAMYNELFGGKGAYTGGALKLPDGRYRYVVNHPGTTGKKIFATAKERAEKVVPEVMARKVVGVWRDALK